MPLAPPGWTPSGLAARIRSLWQGLRRRDSLEAEMVEEFRHHIALRTEDLMEREGLSREAAYRRARLEFGHVEGHREDARASRGLRWFDEIAFSWLDVKLGLRMLAKYPGLSVVSVVGMAVAIAIGDGGYTLLSVLLERDVPLPDGDRIVSIQNNTPDPGNPDRRVLHDLQVWREELGSIRDVGAVEMVRRNLITADGRVTLEPVAVMSASGFRVARVAPVLGRTLVDADEEEGAPAVLVIAYEEWQRRFGADPDIVGRTVRLGGSVHTIVGIMPAGFRFPLAHRYWVPLRVNAARYPRGGGPALYVFGRLRNGATMETAQAELETIGARLAAEYPETHQDLRPTVLPYPYPFTEVDSPEIEWLLRGFRLLLGLLLVIVAVNVSMLVYARTATRVGEIAVRSALGASRRRVITQLFAEALVLSALAAGLGLAVAAGGIAWSRGLMQVSMAGLELPFWFDLRLSAGTVAFAAGLAIVAGVIVGVLPALKVTGRTLRDGLQKIGARGPGTQLGRTWTAMIVIQVAMAVGILPYALVVTGHATRHAAVEPGYPAGEVLRTRLAMERDEAPPPELARTYERELATRYQATVRETLSRLAAHPDVAGVSYAVDYPSEAPYRRFEVEGGGTTGWARSGAIAPNLLRTIDVPVLAGRDLTAADTLPAANAVLVDRVFADGLLGGRNPVGARVRELRAPEGDRSAPVEAGPWLDIVGVVPSFTIPAAAEGPEPNLYRATGTAGAPGSLQLVVRMRHAPPASFSSQLRSIAAGVDPTLQIYDPKTAADVEYGRRNVLASAGLAVLVVTLSVLLLSGAGIYAMISFTVARRRREIGIRSALGAHPGRLLAAIFRRAGLQIGAGVLAGLLLVVFVDRLAGGGIVNGWNGFVLPTVAVLMAGVGLLAAVGPARRALAIEPTEALREE